MGFYLVEELEQGSSELHAWRRGVIGPSDASTIIAENKFKSRAYLGLGDDLCLIFQSGTFIGSRQLFDHANDYIRENY